MTQPIHAGPHLMPAALELYVAAMRIRGKLQIEYERVQPDAPDGECWAEVDRLDDALNTFEQWLVKVDPRLPEAILTHGGRFDMKTIPPLSLVT